MVALLGLVPGAAGTIPQAGAAGAPPPVVGAPPAAKQVPTAKAEVVGRRTRTSRTYANSNGTFSTVYYAGSMNYQDANGAWQPIDNTLVKDSAAGFAYTNRANRYRVHLPASVGGPLKVELGNVSVSTTLLGASGGAVATIGGAALPGGAKLPASALSYQNVLPGVTVAYAAASDAVEEDLVLAGPTATATFTYALATTGLTARANPRGGIDLVDGKGGVPLAFAAPSMVDKRGRRTSAVTLTLGQGPAGQTITLAADPRWLADPTRAFPVTIDPVIVVIGGDVQDCDLAAAYPTTSFCTDSYLFAGMYQSQPDHGLIQFSVPPNNIQILGTEFNLYLYGTLNGSGATTTLNMYKVTQAWTTGATWNTYDGGNGWASSDGDYDSTVSAQATNVGSTLGTWVKFQLPALGIGWGTSTIADDGVLIKEAAETGNEDYEFCPGGGRNVTNGCTAAQQPYMYLVWTNLLGERPFYALSGHGLSDRMGISVNLNNGNLILQARDVAIRGTGLDAVVDRSYQSLDIGSQGVGQRWGLSPMNAGLWFVDNGPSPGFLQVAGNYYVPFTQDQSGNFLSPPGLDTTLVKNGDGTYTLTWHATGERDYFAAAGFPTRSVDKNGNTISYGYGPSGFNAITDTQGRLISLSYGTNGEINTITDPANRTYQYGYDGSGNLTQYTDAAGKITRYAYDGNNNLTQITDPNGNVTVIGYDGSVNGKVTSITYGSGSPVAATWSFSYNLAGFPYNFYTTVTDPNNHQTTYTSDLFGRLEQVTDALANNFQYAWTADNHLSQYTDAKGQPFRYGYDANNNLASVQFPTPAHTSAVYGTVANIPYFFVPTSSTDVQGNQTTYGYDGNGNLTQVRDALPAQNTSNLYYNGNGTVDHAVDARGNTTGFGYDGRGNLTRITPPGPMNPTTVVPDNLSRTGSVTDGNGHQTAYSYDNLDRVTAIIYTGSGQTGVTYTIDNDGNVTAMQDPINNTGYTYDAQNRQTQKTILDGGGHGFTYGYDSVGNLTSFTDNESVAGYLSVTYAYNQADLVTSLRETGYTTTFGYDQNHRRTSTTYPDGVVMSQTYDNSGRLTSIAGMNGGTTLSSFAYSYANGGADTMLPQTYSETLMSPSGSVAQVNGAFTYDQLNRQTKWLVTKQSDGSTVHDYVYGYDGNSNRTQIVADPVNAQGQLVPDPSQGTLHSNESDLTFSAPNEISQIQPYGTQGQPLTPAVYSYDPAGNQTGNNGGGTGKPLTISYLPNNQTHSASDVNQNAVIMTWQGPDQREPLRRVWTDQGHNYAVVNDWSRLGLSGYFNNGVGEPTQPTTVESWLVRDPSGTPVAQKYAGSGQEYYYLFDGQGDVVALEDPGQVQGSYDYCPTGNEADLGGGTSSLTIAALGNPLRQGSQIYVDGLKMYLAGGGITEDYNGTGTQLPLVRATRLPLQFGLLQPARLSLTSGRRTLLNECPTEADPENTACGPNSENAQGPAEGPGAGTGGTLSGGAQLTLNGEPYGQYPPPDQFKASTGTPWTPPQEVTQHELGPPPGGNLPWQANVVIVAERILRILSGNA